MKIELDQYVEFKTVELSRYENSLGELPGWDLLLSYNRTDLENTSCYDDQGRYIQRTVPIAKTFVLLGHRGNLAEKTAKQRDEEISKRCSAESELRKVTEAGKLAARQSADKIQELNSLVELYLKNMESARAERNQAEDKMRLMEVDLAKVRRAIGDIQFNQIVGGPQKV